MAASNAAFSQRTDDLPEEHKLQAQFALAAFGTLKAKKIAYISIPITSGKRLYNYMDAHGFRTPDEAKADAAAFFKDVVKPNLEEGLRASNAWAEKIDGAVVAPVEFEKHIRSHTAINWGQDDFMGMWIPLIEEKVTHMVMIDGWQYSNGSGEEYLQAVLMQLGRSSRSNIEITDAQGKPLPLDQGIKLVADAVLDLTARGLKPRNMVETLALLLEAERRFHQEKNFGISAEPVQKPHLDAPKPSVPGYNHTAVAAIAEKMKPLYAKDYPDIEKVLKKTSSYDFSPMNALFKPAPTLRKKLFPALAA